MNKSSTEQPNKKLEKGKRRNNEKRKEKSRDAARCRRSRESDIFNDFASSLPLPKEEVDHLDKASIMRLSIVYLKVLKMLELFPNMKSFSMDKKLYLECEDVKLSNLINTIYRDKMTLSSLDGFLLILSGDGDITYVSENISEFLGLSQIDLLGQPIWDYSHQCDHEELRDALNGRHVSASELLNGTKSENVYPHVQRDIFLRIKSTLTSRGKNVNIKSATYKVIHITGHIVYSDEKHRQLVAVARPLLHPANIEIPLGCSTFLTKHSLDMKFSYVDDKMASLLGYQPEHLLTKSLFTLHHGEDSETLLSSFKSLINKGQSETHRYRYLARYGGYAWVVTQATVVYDKQKPLSVVCINYAISGVERKDEIYSCAQLEAYKEHKIKQGSKDTKIVKKVLSNNIKINNNENCIVTNEQKNQIIVIKTSKKVERVKCDENDSKPTVELRCESFAPLQKVSENKSRISVRRPHSVTASIFAATEAKLKNNCRSHNNNNKPTASTIKLITDIKSSISKIINRPLNATLKIFAPRTEDMNKGFLMFADEESGLTMLKDEPDDLTHLAPTAGDACIPLEDTTPYFSDMFDDLLIPDTYSTLLPDDLHSIDSQESKEQTCIEAKQIVLKNCGSNENTNNNNSNSNSSDPFINYRDESSDTNSLPHLLSPAGLKKSPDTNSMPSLCSPDDSLPDDDLAFMTLHMEDEMDLRAPYIPMNEAEDLPLLISDDLMWGAHPETLTKEFKNSLGTVTDNIQQQQKHQSIEASVCSKKIDSSLATLLCEQICIPQKHQPQQSCNNKNSIFVDSSSVLNKSKLKLIDSQHYVNPANAIEHPYIHIDRSSSPDVDKSILSETTTLKLLEANPSPSLTNTARNFDKSKTLANKRPNLIILAEPNSKRAKPSLTVSSPIVKTPELLQQLIGTSQMHEPLLTAKIRIKDQSMAIEGGKNLLNDSKINIKCSLNTQPALQSSNSVLMNLLVSGCDISAGYTCFPRPTKTAKA